MAKANKHSGSSFVAFLEEDGIKEDVDLLTVKMVLADEIESRMKKRRVNVMQLATRMKTSRTQVYRLLDKADTGVSLGTLAKAARALDWSIVGLLAAADKGARASRRR